LSRATGPLGFEQDCRLAPCRQVRLIDKISYRYLPFFVALSSASAWRAAMTAYVYEFQRIAF
jgi:hypothetical protein